WAGGRPRATAGSSSGRLAGATALPRPDRQPCLPTRHCGALGGPVERVQCPPRALASSLRSRDAEPRRPPGPPPDEDSPMLARPFLLSTAFAPRPRSAAAPLALSVHTRPTGALVRALVPGVAPESLEVSVEENRLTLSGERSGSTEAGGAPLL